MGFCKDLVSIANARRSIYAGTFMPSTYFVPNVVNRFCVTAPHLNFIPNVQTNCCIQGSAPTFFIPNNFGCNCNKNLYNVDFLASPISGNATAISAGVGIPDYFNGTFIPFDNAMAIPRVQRQAQTLPPEKMLNDLGKLIFLKLLIENMKNEQPLKQTYSKPTTPENNSQSDEITKLKARIAELEKANEGDEKSDGQRLNVDGTDSVSQTQLVDIVKTKDGNPLTGENPEDGLYYENGVQKTLPKLTKKQIRDIYDIFYGDKTEIKGKLENISDDTLLAFLSDKNKIEKVFAHLFYGWDDTKTAGYLINRLRDLIPDGSDLYYKPLSFTPFVGRPSEKPAENYVPVKYSEKLDWIVNKNYSGGTWEIPGGKTMWEDETRDAVYLLAQEAIKYRYKQD